jgi:hypothetical protein
VTAIRNASRVLIAHPFGGTDAVESLLGWHRFLSASDPEFRFAIPPYGFGFIGVEDPSDARAAIEHLATRCDGVVLVSGKVTLEMTFAVDAVHRRGGWISDLTKLGSLPPMRLLPGCVSRHRRERLTDPGAELAFDSAATEPAADVVDFVRWLARDCDRLRSERG